MSNPLLVPSNKPFGTLDFPSVKTEDFLPAIEAVIEENRARLASIRATSLPVKPEDVLDVFEEIGFRENSVAAPFFNLHATDSNDALEAAAQVIAPKLAAFKNDITLDPELFRRVEDLWNRRESLGLDAEGKKVLENTYLGFVRNGAKLSDADKETLRAIDKELSEITLTFADNSRKSRQAYSLNVTDDADLEGLPDYLVAGAKQEAEKRGVPGWSFTLDFPVYFAFMKSSKRRNLRRDMNLAATSAAYKKDEFDNRTNVLRIVELRHKRANLLGYKNHADYTLEMRMAKSSAKVNAFLDEIFVASRPAAERDLKELQDYALKTDGVKDLSAWDYLYYSEKLRMEKYAIDDEVLRPYFRLETTIDGVFAIMSKLYGIKFVERSDIPKYHEDVKTFEVRDASDDSHLAVLYADFFPREGKRSGAWMTLFREQYVEHPSTAKPGKVYRPHVSIVTNFTKPIGDTPSLLTHDEVTTFFHEFGHALHGMLTKCRYGSVAGTNVLWDFVELPSQIHENWCYEKEALDLFARHWQTGEPIPTALIDALRRSQQYQGGYMSLRQIRFALLDLAWHGIDPAPVIARGIDAVDEHEKKATAKADVFPQNSDTNSSASFDHIFAGGYSAGYYSYKWAEVLDADAFEAFKEQGIFNTGLALKFRKEILEKGGSEDPSELFRRFRGREPSIKPLLVRSGLVKA